MCGMSRLERTALPAGCLDSSGVRFQHIMNSQKAWRCRGALAQARCTTCAGPSERGCVAAWRCVCRAELRGPTQHMPCLRHGAMLSLSCHAPTQLHCGARCGMVCCAAGRPCPGFTRAITANTPSVFSTLAHSHGCSFGNAAPTHQMAARTHKRM